MQNNPLYDEAVLAELLRMQEEEPEGFMDLVMKVIKQHPDIVVEDDSDPKKKLMALTKIREHYVEKEEYENCVLIRDLEQKINGKEKE
jgi:hypothetical protein